MVRRCSAPQWRPAGAGAVKIAIVSPESPPDLGGIETYAWEYTRELAKRGHDVTLYTRPHVRDRISLEGVELRPVLRQHLTLDRRAFDGCEADVWHAMNAAYAWLALDGRKTVVSVHGNDFLRPYIPFAAHDWSTLPLLWRMNTWRPAWLRARHLRRSASLAGDALPRCHHLMANSRYTEAALLQKYPGCRGKTSVAWVGVGADFFSVPRRPASDGLTRLLTVCRLSEPRKNVDAVLQALARLAPHFQFRYTIVGEGLDRLRLQALSNRLGLAARVRFTGALPREQLLEHYADADLMVLAASILPGSHEGFGIVYLEAAAAGVPSLAARLAGAAEAVEDGVSGFFVDNPEQEALGEALGAYFRGEQRFDAEACRAFARRHTWDKVVDHVLQYY